MAHPLLSLTPEQVQTAIADIMSAPTALDRLRNPLPPAPPPLWIVPVQPEALAAFQRKLQRVKPWPHSALATLHRTLFKAWNGKCAYCGTALRHPDDVTAAERLLRPCADHLIPTAGGGLVNGATVLSCYSCNVKKGSLDWLVWGKARSPNVRKRLLAMRMEASRFAFNHLSQDAAKVRTDRMIGRMLDARWQHPRFRIYASVTSGGAFIGWQSNWFVSQAALFILKGLKGQPMSGGANLVAYAFDRPADALEAVWALIDHNAWVLGFDLEPDGFDDITPEGAPQWRFWTPNFRNLVSRKPTKDRPKGNMRWKRARE